MTINTKSGPRSAGHIGTMASHVASAILLLLVGAVGSRAQSPEAPAPLAAPQSAPARPVRIQSVGHTVKDLVRSVAFYHDAFAFRVISAPGAWRKVAGMGNGLEAPGARLRSAVLALPGTETTLLLMEYQGASGTPLAPRNSDAGACTLAITVKDVDRALHDARAAGASVITRGQQPLALGPTLRLVFITDPDGFYLELGSAATPEPGGGAGGNAVSVRVGFTIADSEKAAEFYRNTLGMKFQPPRDFAALKAISDLIDVDDIEFKSSFADLTSSSIRLEFLEFRGKSAQSRWGRLQDPGTPLLVLAMSDVPSAARAMTAAGGKALSPAARDAHAHLYLKDPNEIPLELVQAP